MDSRATTENRAPAAPPSAPRNSYGQILKSASLIGGSSLVQVALGIVRTKFVAILLGPDGFGLMNLYVTATSMVSTLAGFGARSSGVRQIAEAAATQDQTRIARSIKSLRRVVLLLGTAGALLLLCLSRPISWLTFRSYDQAGALAWLSLTILFAAVCDGQAALVQGMRHIANLAKLNILGAVFGTCLSIPLFFWLGQKGIVPFLLMVSGMTVLASWWFARKIPVATVTLTWHDIREESKGLVKLGFVIMLAGLMTKVVSYLTRVYIVRHLDIAAAGHYAAAFTLSGLYVGFILDAMCADFLPRLTAVAKDNAECNRLMNEQTEVGLLLAVPGIMATLVLAPLIIQVFYSGKFEPAVEVLRWQVLGVFGRIICWPMAFLLLAKGDNWTFFWAELSTNVVYLLFLSLAIPTWGLAGAGIAYLVNYLFYGLIGVFFSRRVSGFRWSAANLRLAAWLLPAVALAALAAWFLSPAWAAAVGLPVTAVCGICSLRQLLDRLPADRLGALGRVAALLRLRRT